MLHPVLDYPHIDHQPLNQTMPSKPRILHLVWDRKVGGVKSTLAGLIHSPLNQQFEFSVLDIRQDHPLQKSRELAPDLVVCHFPSRLTTMPTLLRFKVQHPGTPVWIHEHGYSAGYERFNVPSRLRFHTMLKLFYGLADRIAAISESQADWMLSNRLTTPEKLFMIRQCPPLHHLLTVPAKRQECPLKLAAYGRFCPQKGFDLLIAALRRIPDVPVHVYLGGEGELEAQLHQQAQGLGSLTFVGRVDNVPAFLSTCDAVIIPSRWEPWGNVCVEAKAAGRPVLVADIDGLTEQSIGCGIRVAPDDVEALAAGIRSLVETPPAQLQAWGQHGRDLVLQNWDDYITAWGDIFRSQLTPQL